MDSIYEVIDGLRRENADLKLQLVRATRVNGELNDHIDMLELMQTGFKEEVSKHTERALRSVRATLVKDRARYVGYPDFQEGVRHGLTLSFDRIDSKLNAIAEDG